MTSHTAVTRTTLQFRALLLLLAVTGAVGCNQGKSPSPGDGAGRRGASLSISITSGLEANETLEHGETMIVGTVSGGMLNADEPLIMRVTDVASGLSSSRDIAFLADGPGDSSVNLSTGAFVIDCIDDLRIGEGSKTITLTAKASDDTTTSISVSVTSTAQFEEQSWSDVLAARQVYGSEMRHFLDSYVAWAEALPVDPEDFPAYDADIAVLHALQDYYNSWHTDPDRGDWNGATDSLTAVLEEIDGEFPATGEEDAAFRVTLGKYAASIARNHQKLCESRDAVLNLRPASFPPTEAVGWWQGYIDFYENTFYSELAPPTAFTWRGGITMNEGTPTEFPPLNYVSDIEPDTADTNTPAFDLRVEAQDLDNDLLADQLNFHAEYLQEVDDLVTFEDTPPTNHLFAPLMPLINCVYWE